MVGMLEVCSCSVVKCEGMVGERDGFESRGAGRSSAKFNSTSSCVKEFPLIHHHISSKPTRAYRFFHRLANVSCMASYLHPPPVVPSSTCTAKLPLLDLLEAYSCLNANRSCGYRLLGGDLASGIHSGGGAAGCVHIRRADKCVGGGSILEGGRGILCY